MKQKYTIIKDKNKGSLTIQEYAELDKDIFSLVCEETYDIKEVESAASEGKLKLIAKLRTPNLYPIAEYADKIADATMGFFQKNAKTNEPVELFFDDSKNIKSKSDESASAENHKSPSAVIEDLLDNEDFEEIPDAVDAEEEQEDVDSFDEEKDE